MPSQRENAVRRRTLLLVALLVIALAVGGAVLYGTTRGVVGDPPGMSPAASPTTSDPSTSRASPTASPAAPSATGADSATPSPEPTPSRQSPGPVSTDEAGERTAVEGIAFDEPAELADQIELTVEEIEDVDGEVTVPGEVARPALRFTVGVENSGSVAVDTTYQAVNAYYGPENTPAAPFLQPGGTPFPGSVPPESAITGVYLFDVPVAERDEVVLEVDINPRLPVARFSGDVG